LERWLSPSRIEGDDLAPLADARLVPSAVAQVLGFDIRSDDPVLGLVAALRDRRLVLVLDNCEHVIEAAATLAVAILRGAADIHILATSREPLRAEGEHVQRLPPLSSGFPSDHRGAAKALAFPAVELFVERAAERLGDFELTDENALLVAEICRKLDGIPLAIELVAARVESFGVKADPVRCKRRAAVLQQSPLRSRRWPRSAVPRLRGKRCCAPDRSRARRRALRLHVQRGVPAPRRQATPILRIDDNPCESWPGPS
jgi:hypothetical protein